MKTTCEYCKAEFSQSIFLTAQGWVWEQGSAPPTPELEKFAVTMCDKCFEETYPNARSEYYADLDLKRNPDAYADPWLDVEKETEEL